MFKTRKIRTFPLMAAQSNTELNAFLWEKPLTALSTLGRFDEIWTKCFLRLETKFQQAWTTAKGISLNCLLLRTRLGYKVSRLRTMNKSKWVLKIHHVAILFDFSSFSARQVFQYFQGQVLWVYDGLNLLIIAYVSPNFVKSSIFPTSPFAWPLAICFWYKHLQYLSRF